MISQFLNQSLVSHSDCFHEALIVKCTIKWLIKVQLSMRKSTVNIAKLELSNSQSHVSEKRSDQTKRTIANSETSTFIQNRKVRVGVRLTLTLGPAFKWNL